MITVYSISYCKGRSERVHWTFFETEKEAQSWLDGNYKDLRKAYGPFRHVAAAGKKGIVSMLNTYST